MLRHCLATLLLTLPVAAQNLDKFGEQLGQLGAKTPATEISLVADPADARVRPLETLIVRVHAWATKDSDKLRLRRTGTKFRVVEPGGGWVSKPFAWQGADDAKYFEESSNSAWNVFNEATGRFVVKDSVLYTAPAAPGKYTIEAELETKRATIEIQVAADAASRVKAETVSFPPLQASSDPYRRLAEHWAPFLAQETWFQPKSDYPARFDYDGDWQGDNNWDSLETGSSQAYVHYAVMGTGTHFFVIYNVFHPRDYSDRCVVGTCHENDNEGLILTVHKDGSEFGRLQVMQTLAHNNVYTFTADSSVRGGAHSISGAIELQEGSHPAVFIESGGHGIYGSTSEHSRFTLASGEFQGGTGVTMVYKGVAEKPKHANDRLVGYDLLPIYDEWWSKAVDANWGQRTFDSSFDYQPFGGRPALAAAIGSCFMGRKEAANKAKPFWGWHDTGTLKKRILNVGQWALDPAYAVSKTLKFPPGQAFSLDYVYNPFLGVGTPQAVQPARATQALESAAGPGLSAPVSGEAEISVRVDGSVELFINAAEVRAEVTAGAPPVLERADFKVPIPAAPLTSFKLTKTAGRGSVILVEQPTAQNSFAAHVRVEDPKGGADSYRFRLSWTQ
ncbi:MAG TPA: hypothetical protein VN428_18670 [Bryobacteraceae bacterium]|nr:hypothetical protein [Bryobacteraceae bacterium]